MLFLIAFFLSNADLATLRLVSSDFAWIDKIMFKMIEINITPDLLERAQSFMGARSIPLTIRGLSFTSIFARQPARGFSSWGVLGQAIPVLVSRGEVTRVETIRMSTSSTDIIRILSILRRCGITTIRRLDLQNFIGFRGAYTRDAATLPGLLAGIESIHMSFDYRIALATGNADFLAFMAWLAASCNNLRVLEVSSCLGVDWLPQVFLPPFNPIFGQARFRLLRSLLISDVLLDRASFGLLLFTGCDALEKVRLHRIRLQDLYWNPFFPQFHFPGGIRYDVHCWPTLIGELDRFYRTRRTQVEIWRPFMIRSDNGRAEWHPVINLQNNSAVVTVLDWDTVVAGVST